jgi:hypothetical protein
MSTLGWFTGVYRETARRLDTTETIGNTEPQVKITFGDFGDFGSRSR